MIKTPKAVVSDIGSTNAGQWVVNLDMTKNGRRKWSKFTGGNINRQVAIMLDGKVFMAPFIRDKITTGSTQISGFENMEEAKDIASVLNYECFNNELSVEALLEFNSGFALIHQTMVEGLK